MVFCVRESCESVCVCVCVAHLALVKIKINFTPQKHLDNIPSLFFDAQKGQICGKTNKQDFHRSFHINVLLILKLIVINSTNYLSILQP